MGRFDHPQLGQFEADGTDSAHTVRRPFIWCGKEIRLILDGEGGTFEAAASHALALIDKQQLWQVEFANRIYDRLYKTWDEGWREDDTSIDGTQWLARMELLSLKVSTEGYFSVMLSDGDLFWGHWIEVFGKVDEGVKSVDLRG